MRQEQEAPSSEVTEVGPNVLRTQLPLTMPGLGHVNMYVLLDDQGAAVVDPGMPGPGTWSAIVDRLKKCGLAPKNVHTVVVTHSHPDHFGGAGKLAQEGGGELITHSAFRTWWSTDEEDLEIFDVDPEDLESEPPWGSPWGGEEFRPPLKRRLQFRLMRSGLMRKAYVRAEPTKRVRHGDVVKLAGREWFAVHTPGHTIDHLCLHDPEGKLLLSGDHVLPTITPHVSGVGSGRDPLKLFNDSLDRVATLKDEVANVLPAHGHPFTDLAGRVDSIQRHHHDRLEEIRGLAADLGPTTVTEFSHHLFRKERWGGMAESETYAHLEHLRLMGDADAERRDGKLVYQLTK